MKGSEIQACDWSINKYPRWARRGALVGKASAAMGAEWSQRVVCAISLSNSSGAVASAKIVILAIWNSGFGFHSANSQISFSRFLLTRSWEPPFETRLGMCASNAPADSTPTFVLRGGPCIARRGVKCELANQRALFSCAFIITDHH